MNLNQYQEEAGATAVYPGSRTIDGLLYVVAGLNGEAGEISDHAKKVLRDDGGEITDERLRKLKKELGDVCWYCARVSHEAAFKLGSAVLQMVDWPEMGYDDYPGSGTYRGFMYLVSNLNREASRVSALADTLVPVEVPSGTHWITVGQGRTIQSRLKVGVARVLWYTVAIARYLKIDLEETLKLNVENLAGRKQRGTLHGEGSDR